MFLPDIEQSYPLVYLQRLAFPRQMDWISLESMTEWYWKNLARIDTTKIVQEDSSLDSS